MTYFPRITMKSVSAPVRPRRYSDVFIFKLHGRELVAALPVVKASPNAAGSAYGHSQQPQMIKSISALGLLCLLGAAVVLLPVFAPPLEAKETVALAKADRLEIQQVARNCSKQVWPRFDTACLRRVESGATVHEARLVTAPTRPT